MQGVPPVASAATIYWALAMLFGPLVYAGIVVWIAAAIMSHRGHRQNMIRRGIVTTSTAYVGGTVAIIAIVFSGQFMGPTWQAMVYGTYTGIAAVGTLDLVLAGIRWWRHPNDDDHHAPTPRDRLR